MTDKYEEVLSEIRSEIKTLNGGKELFYKKNYARIGINTDDNLPLNKPLKFPTYNNYQMRPSRGWNIVSTNLLRRVFVCVLKMLKYDRIDAPGGIDINKTSENKWIKRMYALSLLLF